MPRTVKHPTPGCVPGFLLSNDNILCYDVIMIRTQISLSAQDYEAAKREATRRGISLAELLRQALRGVLPPLDDDQPWMRYSGMVESGDPQVSRSIDATVYE